MKKAVLFDMDGLMIDSERVTFEEYQKKLHTLGYHDFDEHLYIQCLGKNKQGICQVFLGHYGNHFPIEEVWDDVHVNLDHRLFLDVPIKNGLFELLKYLKTKNIKIVVATSSARKRANLLFQKGGFSSYLDASVCGDEIQHGKPNPEIFLKACERVQVTCEEALVLEDSEAGILAAHKAGIDVICVPDMKLPDQRFQEMTLALCEKLEDVISYIK